MSTPPSFLVRAGHWLQNKRNFYVYSILVFGLPSWPMLIWITWDYSRHPMWIAFLGIVSLGGGLLWGFGMWHLFVRPWGARGGDNDAA